MLKSEGEVFLAVQSLKKTSKFVLGVPLKPANFKQNAEWTRHYIREEMNFFFVFLILMAIIFFPSPPSLLSFHVA